MEEITDFSLSAAAYITFLVVCICILSILHCIKVTELNNYKAKYAASINYISEGLPDDDKEEIMAAILERIDEEAKARSK